MKRRYMVRYKPATKTEKAMLRGIGLFHAFVGAVFALIALTAIIPNAGLIGLLFLAAGVFFAVNGVLVALGKTGLIGRSYQIEEEAEDGMGPNQPPLSPPPAETHDHIPSIALDAKQRLEQLESLKSAGLIDEREYREKRQEILRGL